MKGNSKATSGNSLSPLGTQSKDKCAALQMLLGTLRSNNMDGNEDVKKKRFYKQNNKFAGAPCFFVHFSARANTSTT